MLKENGAPPGGKWAELRVLEPVRGYKARHASTMLTFDAVVSALDEIARRVGAAAEVGGLPRSHAVSGALSDPRLSAHLVGADRPPMPPPAVLLRLHGRGDPAARALGRRLDGFARICRCGPFGTSGLDLVPEALPAESPPGISPGATVAGAGVNAPPAILCEAAEPGRPAVALIQPNRPSRLPASFAGVSQESRR